MEHFILNVFPNWLNKLRIFPRLFIGVYLYLLIKITFWFMLLTDPSNQQAMLISVAYGAGAAWFGLYVGSGNGPSTPDSLSVKTKDVSVDMEGIKPNEEPFLIKRK